MFASSDMSFHDYCLEQEKHPLLWKLLPYRSFDPETGLFFNEGATGFVLMGNPIVGSSVNDQQAIAQFLRQNPNLVTGSSLQFLLFASPCIGEPLDEWNYIRRQASPEQTIYHKMSQRRTDYLKSKAFDDADGNLIRDYKLMISFTVPGHKETILEQTSLIQFRNELQTLLAGLSISTQVVDAENLIKEVGAILNIEDDIYPYRGQWNERDSISKEVIDAVRDFEVKKDGVLMNGGKTFCRSYIPKTSRKTWGLGAMDMMLGALLRPEHKISCPYLLHYGLFIVPKQFRLKAKAFAKSQSLEKQLINGMSKFAPDLSDEYAESKEVVEELQRGGQMISTCFNYTIFSTPEKILHHQQQLRQIWGEAEWSFQATTRDHLFMLLSSLPMTWTTGYKSELSRQVIGAATGLKSLGRAKLTVSKEAQNMLPLLAEWKGQAAPGIPLAGRRGQLFFWNPFDRLLLPNTQFQYEDNHNVCIAGVPGSGKSFFLQEMMANVIGAGGKCFVLDLGRSFKKTCYILRGRHIEFNVRYPISLNPFSHIPTGDSQEDIETRSDMLALAGPTFQVMAAPKQGTTDLENSFLDQAVRYAWEKYKTSSNVDAIQEYLLKHDNNAAKDLGEKLSCFSSKGSFGHFFNPPANTNLKESLIVIETDDLRSYPNLMAVVVQMLITQINQEMAKGSRQRPFLIIIDEAWRMLAGRDTAKFVGEASRIARKYRGGIICATQHLTDYFKPEAPGATEAFNCSSWKCILRQEDDVITALKSHPQLQSFVDDEYKELLLRSIHSKAPHYSEVAIFGPKVRGIVGRLMVDPFSRLLYSTNPQEYQAIENLTNQGLSIEEAVEHMVMLQEQGMRHA